MAEFNFSFDLGKLLIKAQVRGKPKDAKPPTKEELADWTIGAASKTRMMSLNMALAMSGGLRIEGTVDNATSVRAMEEREEQELIELLLLTS